MKNLTFPSATLFLAVLGFSLVAGTSPAGQSPSYVYDSKIDLFGYYLPTAEVRVGKFKLHDLALGGADDFKKYLAGNRLTTYAPVMVEFDDVTSKQRTNEMGQPYYENAPRVLPVSFRVTDKTVVFEGNDKQLGRVTFSGKLNAGVIALEKDQEHGEQNLPALIGDLAVGDAKFKNVKFTWFGGD